VLLPHGLLFMFPRARESKSKRLPKADLPSLPCMAGIGERSDATINREIDNPHCACRYCPEKIPLKSATNVTPSEITWHSSCRSNVVQRVITFTIHSRKRLRRVSHFVKVRVFIRHCLFLSLNVTRYCRFAQVSTRSRSRIKRDRASSLPDTRPQ